MNLFHDYIITWQQASLLKLGLVALGAIIGAAWPVFFKKSVVWWILWVIVIASLIYLVIAFWPQVFRS